jgi:hypothetical protein
VITPDNVALFVEDKQLDESVKKYLGQNVDLKPYGSFFEYLKSLSSSLNLGADYVRSLFSSYQILINWFLCLENPNR